MSDPWPYVWDGAPRPFVHPVRTPAGHVLTVDAPQDHPWHHALWFTIKFVNGMNFWEEYGEFGILRQHAAPVVDAVDDAGMVHHRSALDWTRPEDDGIVIRETLDLTHRPIGDGIALDWDIRLRPEVDVVLDRTPFTTWGGYGGLTLRGRPDWRDTVLRLPDGADRARVLGDTGNWCALDGTLTEAGGDHDVGFVMFDHPDNPVQPLPWYASTRADTYRSASDSDDDWSNFMNAAFLWDGPMSVDAGAELRIRHRCLAHDGIWSIDRLSSAFAEWIGAGT